MLTARLRFLALAALVLSPAPSRATVNLTTNIAMPNLTRWHVVRADDHADDASPYLVLCIEVRGAGGVVYSPPQTGPTLAPWCLRVTDSVLTTERLGVNPTPLGYHDRLLVDIPGISGAYTTITAAMAAASGRAEKRRAAETACLSAGVCGAGLAGT